MKLVEMAPPDRGALAIVYDECPECALPDRDARRTPSRPSW